jgi:hypothetical protein
MNVKWLEAALTMARNALRSTDRTPVQRAEDALAKLRTELAEARAEVQRGESALRADQARALDGEVTAGELESRRSSIERARGKVTHLEGIERALQAKAASARQNDAVLEASARRIELHKHVAAIGEGVRKIAAGVELILAGIKQVRAASAQAKGLVPPRPQGWPEIWERPAMLNAAVCIELVRGDPVVFHGFGYGPSFVHGQPTIVERHRRAVAEILPEEPVKRAA